MAFHIFKLSTPVSVEGVTYSELSWREPKGRDVRGLLDETVSFSERQHRLLVNLCEVPGEVLDEIPASDYAALAEMVGPFLAPRKKN